VKSSNAISRLTEQVAIREVPQHIRNDNAPEFVVRAIQRRLGQVGVQTLYIAPGAPWENGNAESFPSCLRHEFLALELFESVASARKLITAWQDDYNHHRPHTALGNLAPKDFASTCQASLAS
jgi:transposase InsO family protein